MIPKSKVWGIRVLPQTKRKMQVVQKKSQIGSWDSFFEFIMALDLEKSESRDLLKLLTEKIKKSTRTSGLETGEYIPLFLFLEKDTVQRIQEQAKYPGAFPESVVERLVNKVNRQKEELSKLSPEPSQPSPVQKSSQPSSVQKPAKKLSHKKKVEQSPKPAKKLSESSQTSDIARWSKHPLIKIPTLEDVQIRLIEKKTIEETSEIRKRYRTYFCEVKKNDLLMPYWLELYIEKLQESAKSENEVISKIDPEGFKFWKEGYESYGELEKAVGGVEKLFGKLAKGELK